jgi:hypothetical protein
MIALSQEVDDHLVVGAIGLVEDMVRGWAGVLGHFVIRPELM